MLPDFVDGQHQPLLFRRADIEAAVEETIILESEGSERPGEED